MSLKRKILELQMKREKALQGGGEKAIEKQVAMGKMTARERIITLLDEKVNVLFFDVTTLYFESQKNDGLKNFGYSKDNKVSEALKKSKIFL